MTSYPYDFPDVEIRCRESQCGNLVISIKRQIESMPFNSEYHITRQDLGIDDRQFCNLNKTLDYVFKTLSRGLGEHIRTILNKVN